MYHYKVCAHDFFMYFFFCPRHRLPCGLKYFGSSILSLSLTLPLCATIPIFPLSPPSLSTSPPCYHPSKPKSCVAMVTASPPETELCDLGVPQPFSQLVKTPSFTTSPPESCHHYRSVPLTTIHAQCSHSINWEAELWINMIKLLSVNEDYQSTFLPLRYQNSDPWFATIVLSRSVTAFVYSLN